MEKLEIYPREDRRLFLGRASNNIEAKNDLYTLDFSGRHLLLLPSSSWGSQAESPLVKQTAIASFIQRAHWGRDTFHIWDGNILTCVLINFMNILSHDINALTPVSYSIPFPFAPKWRQFFCNCQYSKNMYITAFCSRTSIGPVPSGISYF